MELFNARSYSRSTIQCLAFAGHSPEAMNKIIVRMSQIYWSFEFLSHAESVRIDTNAWKCHFVVFRTLVLCWTPIMMKFISAPSLHNCCPAEDEWNETKNAENFTQPPLFNGRHTPKTATSNNSRISRFRPNCMYQYQFLPFQCYSIPAKRFIELAAN